MLLFQNTLQLWSNGWMNNRSKSSVHSEKAFDAHCQSAQTPHA